MSINITDAADAERLSIYLMSRTQKGISPKETQNAKTLSMYLSRNSTGGSIGEDDVKDVEKLCNFINRAIR